MCQKIRLETISQTRLFIFKNGFESYLELEGGTIIFIANDLKIECIINYIVSFIFLWL